MVIDFSFSCIGFIVQVEKTSNFFFLRFRLSVQKKKEIIHIITQNLGIKNLCMKSTCLKKIEFDWPQLIRLILSIN